MTVSCKRRHKRIGEILMGMGCLSADDLSEALGVQAGQADRGKLGELLVSRGLIQRHHLDAALARQNAGCQCVAAK